MTELFRKTEFVIALAGLFFMSGTLTSFLTPPGSESAPMVQVLGGALGLFSIIVLLASRGAISQIIGLYWLALLPVLFAVLSLIWTVDASLTLRRAGSLGLTTAFGFWLAYRFSADQIFRLLVLMSLTIIVVNFAIIQLQPARGIHQPYDLISAQHAGSWRGLFGHKNDFGRLIALTAPLLMLGFFYGVLGRYQRWLILPLIGLSLLLILRSNSSQAVLLVVVVPAAVALLLMMRSMTPAARSFLLIVTVTFSVIAAFSAQMVFEYALGLLGRDATLTGRTIIWEGVILALGGNGVVGGGYGAGWDMIAPRLTALTGAEVGHAHNGFLDLAVDVGAVGLGLTLLFMLCLGGMAFRNLMRGIEPEISALALAAVIFSLIGNLAGSFLLLHNSIYWIILVVTFAKLRDVAVLPYQMPDPYSAAASPPGMYARLS